MGNVILSLSSTTHSLDSLSNRGAEATSWVTRAFDFFVPPPLLIFFSLSALQDPLCVFKECLHTILHFFFFAAYSLFLLAELDEHQVSREEGTKDMVTGSRLSTSARQLCICLHLTPAKSPSGSLPHSSLHVTSTHPPSPKGFPSYCRGNQLKGATAFGSAERLTSITHTPASRPRPRYRRLWKLVRFKGD